MNGAWPLLVATVLAGLVGHRPLLWLGRRGIDPAVLMIGWVVATVGLVVSSVSLTAVLVLPADDHPASEFFALAGGCWTALSTGTLPGWREGSAGIGLVAGAAVLARLVWVVRGRRRAWRRTADHLTSLRGLAAQVPVGQPLEVRDDRPLAVSIGGRPGIIVISDGLRACLSPSALSATLAHERAHLSGRHHVLISVTETLASALPVVPVLRAAPEAVRDLAELAADRVAARRCGSAAVHEALTQVSSRPPARLGPAAGSSLGLAGMTLHLAARLTDTRLQRLAGGADTAPPLTRVTTCLSIAAGSLLLPVATGALLLNAVGCVVG